MIREVTIEPLPDEYPYTCFRSFISHTYYNELMPWEFIIINLPETKAILFFQDYFGKHPLNVTDYAIGHDFSISGGNNVEHVTQHLRPFISKEERLPLEQFLKLGRVLYLKVTEQSDGTDT